MTALHIASNLTLPLEAVTQTFGTYLGKLRRNGLIDVDGNEVRASDTLFLGEKVGV